MAKVQFIALTAALMLAGQVSAKGDKQITITYKGNKATVVNELKDSAEVKVDGSHVSLTSQYTQPIKVTLAGKSEDGTFVLKNDGRVKLSLNNLDLTSKEGAPLWLKNKKRVEITAPKGTTNNLVVVECQDTANYKAACIFAKENIKLSGKGTLNVTSEGKGCKGINAKGDITIEELTLNVETKGDNWNSSRGKFGGMGGFGGGFGGFGGFGGGDFNPDSIPNFGGGFPGGFGGGHHEHMEGDSIPGGRREGRGHGPRGGMGGFGGGFPGGGFPGFGGGEFNPDSIPDFGGGFPGGMGGFGGFGGGFPGFGGGEDDEDGEGGFVIPPMGGGGGHGNAKAICCVGDMTINSGTIKIKTAFHGGEGLESKQVMTFNGGDIYIDAVDDGINCAKQIVFNGGTIIAKSSTNDAVDCNGNRQPIIINGGTIYAWSSTGSPEEGMDCDFSAIIINGGKLFTMGGGMGEEPSKPSAKSAKQPAVMIVNLVIEEGDQIEVYEGTPENPGKKIDSFSGPFNLRQSASVLSYPEFQPGGTYFVKTKQKTVPFTFTENYVKVRS